jgi:hypothetical protein
MIKAAILLNKIQKRKDEEKAFKEANPDPEPEPAPVEEEKKPKAKKKAAKEEE